MLAINLIWQAANLLAVIINISDETGKPMVANLYSSSLFLMLKVCGYASTLIILSSALILYYQMKSLIYQQNIQYDNEIKESQKSSLQKFLVLIKWLTFISVTLLIFEVISFTATNHINWRLISSPLWLNDLTIAVIRMIAYISWAIPVFSLFWPQIVSAKRRQELLS